MTLSINAWQDTSRPTAERVEDLMSRMTVREKVAQLYGVWLDTDETSGEVAPHHDGPASGPIDFDDIIGHGLGQITRHYGTAPVAPADGARRLADLQRRITSEGRFGIPAVVHEECLTGFAAWQAPVFPGPLSWGATFDPALIEELGAHIGRTMRRLGVHQGLAPVLDVVRDLRWGRVEESIGEDPLLVGTIGAAYVRGLESSGVIATLKHFAGYSASRAGRNHAPVSIGPRELADVLLVPFEMALRAGAGSVMNSYSAIDGVPAAASADLLTTILRERFRFTGTVVSDYFAVGFLQDAHGVAATLGDAARLALNAGIDVELPFVNCFGQPLLDELDAGRVELSVVDRAVTRVLIQKCELGLLDPAWSPDEVIGDPGDNVVLDDPLARDLARRVAGRSIVMLHNDGILPLSGRRRVAMVGPNADTADAMLGCYSFPRHVGIHHPAVPRGIAIPSLLDAFADGHDVTHALGCPVLGGDDAGIAEAVEAARAAELCIVALGDVSGLFGRGTSGEGCDATDLRLPGRQEELLEAVLATGTPVVLVLFVGRPYDLSRQVDRLAAIVCGFLPGEEGAAALSDVLNGRADPSGRLPLGFPNGPGGQPFTYLGPHLAQHTDVSTADPTPLFAFGHGLSFAPATWETVSCGTGDTWPTDGSASVSVVLRNDNARATSEVVQVYLHDPVAEVNRPVRQLIAASRVDLAPGATKTVDIALHADLTSFTGLAGTRIVDSGAVELWIGASSTDIRGTVHLTMTGRRREVGYDRVMYPQVTVS